MKVLIVGAGPAGLLLANYLMKRPGYDIQIIERRPDPRELSPDSLRTFPIALQSRGLEALMPIPGLQGAMENQGIWVTGACFHQGKKTRKIIRDRPIISIDRNQIALTLLNHLVHADKAKGTSLSIQFDCSIQDTDLGRSSVTVTKYDDKTKSSLPFDYLVAADGARSKIRQHLAKTGDLSVEQKDLPDDYRTIFLARKSHDGSICLESDFIHGWMLDGGRVRVVTAPIHEGCVSGAFIFEKGRDPFLEMKSPEHVQAYFERISPSSLAKLMTFDEAVRLLSRPTSTVVSVRCDRLHVRDQVLLLGDAAHAVSASVGHGCNSALQDVQVFCGLLDQYQDDWDKSLQAYTTERLADAHALSDLSDYSTPRTKWMKKEWLLRSLSKKILPSWLSRFMRPLPMELLVETTLSYAEVLQRTRWWIDRVKHSH